MSIKETDSIRVHIGRSQPSVAKAIRRKKAEKDSDGARVIWETDQNKQNRIRKRIEDYLKEVDIVATEYYPEELKKELQEIKRMPSEKAKEEIKKYNKIIIPKEGEREINFDNLEDVTDYIIYGPKGEERLKFWNLFNKAYPKSMYHLFSVDGEKKTNLEKIINKQR